MDTNAIYVTDGKLLSDNHTLREQDPLSSKLPFCTSDAPTAKMVNERSVMKLKRRKSVRNCDKQQFGRRNRQIVVSKNAKASAQSKQDQRKTMLEERIPPLHCTFQNFSNGLLDSVLKTDLAEILRRSCRAQKTYTRFSGCSSISNKGRPPNVAHLGANSSGESLSNVTTARGLRLKKKNGIFIDRKIKNFEDVETLNERDILDPLNFDNAMKHDKRGTVCRNEKARKSFPPRKSLNGILDEQLTTKPRASSKALIFKSCGIASSESSILNNDDAVPSAPSTDGSYLQVRSCVLKRSRRRGRHFKGSTYYLSIHPNRRKRKIHSVGNLVAFAKTKLNHVVKKKAECMLNSESDRMDESGASMSTKSSAAKEGLQNTEEISSKGRLEPTLCKHLPPESSAEQLRNMSRNSMGNQEMFISKKIHLCSKDKDVSNCDDSSCGVRESTADICQLKPSDGRLSEMTVESILMMKSPLTNVHSMGNLTTESMGTCNKVNNKNKEENNVVTVPKSTKANNGKCGPWSSPLSIPFAWNEEKKRVTSVTVQQVEFVMQGHLLCTCSTQDGSFISKDIIKSYCQGIDYIDCRLIGCVNSVTTNELLRPSVRVPFQALCELHRRRLKMHQCCPCCGLFCTQGSFIQCYADPQKPVHHSHKECIIYKDSKPLCPHCGKQCQLVETDVEINTPQSITFFLKQHQQLRKEPGARMAFTRGNENIFNVDLSDSLPVKSYRLSDSGKEISTAGLPIGTYREQLETLLENLTNDQPVNQRYSLKNIHAAVKNGDVEKLIQVLMIGFDPNTRFDEFGRATVLHIAAYHGHLCLVHILTQGGASLDALDSMLQTPIMLSIENGHTLVSQYLIKAGAQLDSRGEDGMTALHLAAKAGQLDICRIILDTGKVNVNILDDGGWTPLVWAAEHQHLNVVKFLLERGSNPNLRDNEHNIALHWSAYSGSLDICEIFLNHGCDINSVNDNGDTPLHIAARQDRYEVVMLLLARNADVDACNKENEAPIMCCHDQTAQTWLALSMTKHLKKMSANRTNRTEVIVHKDISRGKELNPIQCVNNVDDECAPSDFIYVNENCETLPINMDRSISSLQSCQCEDDCSSPSCTCGTMSLKCWYTKEGKLVEAFNLLDPPMIFECNRACKCWTSCNNRVVQHGITCRLQLFRTKQKGWGVRALQEIPRGTFICEYIGELISDLEADQREDDSYLFDLDNRDGETFCIDARRYGNVSRFINHLCEPNLVPVKIFVDYQDFRFPRIAFFSSRTIGANEELGFDYGDKFWIIKSKTFTCSCGVEKCKYSETTIQDTLNNYHRRLQEQD